jgi:hypothetical protein
VDSGGTPLDFEVASLWQVKARFTATTGDAEATVKVHAFDADASQWYPLAEMTIRGTTDAEVGGVMTLDGVFGTTHCAFEVGGLGDTDAIVLMFREKNV